MSLSILNTTEMKINFAIFWNSVLILLILNSCVTRKKVTYLQSSGEPYSNILQSSSANFITPTAYKIMPYDNLFIRVVTPDPQWSALFNMDFGSAGLTQESAGLSGYPVDSKGEIEIPYVGKIKVAGRTLLEIQVKLDSVFKNYVADASIAVRLVNNYISIIGEVKTPGRYILTKDRINIFEAISMAGDMSDFSNRQKVQLIRPSPYGPIIKEFSLKDKSILTSEFYYIMPNDIIYAQPRKGRGFGVNSTVYSLILSSIATILSSITTIFVVSRY